MGLRDPCASVCHVSILLLNPFWGLPIGIVPA